tara:strand:- start:53 stop:340 length:288 start_codon:yes stop_codon:yes gene_type:complete
MNATKVYRLPPTFVLNHIARDFLDHERHLLDHLPSGRKIVVRLNEAEYKELMSDAKFYVEMGSGELGFGSESFGLVRSAAATVKALTIQQAPPER